MRMYKTAKIGSAVQALRNYHNGAAQLLDELERAKKRYNTDGLMRKRVDAQAKFYALYQAAKTSIDDAVAEVEELARKAQSDFLSIGNAENDYKLLALPITLSPDELRAMVKRNEGNGLFARTVAKYAEEHGYTGLDYNDFKLMAISKSAYEKHLEDAQNLRYTFEMLLPSDKLLNMSGSHHGKALDRLEAEGFFSKEV